MEETNEINPKKQLEIIYKIRDKMVADKISVLELKGTKFHFNKFPSPDGALGFFMLLKRSEFEISSLISFISSFIVWMSEFIFL